MASSGRLRDRRRHATAANPLEPAVERRQVHARRRHASRSPPARATTASASRSAIPASGSITAFVPHVFDRFRQADSGTTREQGGLGLGLAIVRELVRLHGGDVDAQSAGIGRGSTLRHPLRASGEPPRVLDRRDASRATNNLAGHCVVVVEDHDDSRELMRDHARERGRGGRGVRSLGERRWMPSRRCGRQCWSRISACPTKTATTSSARCGSHPSSMCRRFRRSR